MRACIGTVARAPSSAAAAAAAERRGERLARRRRRSRSAATAGRERVDHRLVARLGGAELDDAGERRVERGGERRRRRAPARRRARGRRGGAPMPHSGPLAPPTVETSVLPARISSLPGRRARPAPAERLAHRVEPARHVDAVVAVADRGVELRQVVGLAPSTAAAISSIQAVTVRHCHGDLRCSPRSRSPAQRGGVDGSIPQLRRARRRARAASATRPPSRAR